MITRAERDRARSEHDTAQENAEKLGIKDPPPPPEEPPAPVILAPIPDYPLEALRGTPLHDIAKSDVLPSATLGAAALAVLSGLCGKSVLEMNDSSEYGSAVWIVVVDQPGAAKTPVLKRVQGPLRRKENETRQEDAELIRQWKADGAEGDPPRRHHLSMTDITIEAVARRLADNDGPGMIVAD
jgi:hypothetical protein